MIKNLPLHHSYFSMVHKIVNRSLVAIVFSSNLFAQSDTIETTVPALKNVYANDFYIGCLLSYAHVGFPDDPYVPGQSNVVAANGGRLIQFHMNSMSPGNWMKSTYIVDINGSASAYSAAVTQAEKDSIDVHPRVTFNGNITAQLNWAKRQDFTFRGHTLVWHNQHPGTAFFRSGYTNDGTRLTKEKMSERMENYIKEVIRILHEGWPGLLTAFDVVNEAVNDNGTDRTTNNEWYTTFGDMSFVNKAFEFARKYTAEYGETQIKLYYNDYNTHLPAKADGIVRICKPIFDAGLLDGIGMQDHDQNASPTAAQWIASYDKFDSICTEMSVTELDVNPGTVTPASLRTQANQYAMLFKCFVERSARSGRGKIVSVSKDGLNDQWAFVANASLWTNLNKCKPAFFSAVNAGINYNALDSLIEHADTLDGNRYSAGSWAHLTSVLASAKTARDQNYSSTVPADTMLGNAKDSLTSALAGLVVTGVDDEVSYPEFFALYQNYPNPFNPVTEIRYQIPDFQVLKSEISNVTLKVFDVLGREVATLVDETKEPGNYMVIFDASQHSSGIYFYTLRAGNLSVTKKCVLMK